MTKVEALAALVRLGCETEDRSPAEQKALLLIAHDVDKVRNMAVATNPNFDYDLGRLREVSGLAIEVGCSKATCRVCAKSRRLISNGGVPL